MRRLTASGSSLSFAFQASLSIRYSCKARGPGNLDWFFHGPRARIAKTMCLTWFLAEQMRYSSLLLKRPTRFPAGSEKKANQPIPGISVLVRSVLPPSSSAFASEASMSSVET